MDALFLARIQFAANIAFHILFPTISIALAFGLLFFKLRFNATGEDKWMDAYRFWVKVFALGFAIGVVSGITMSFQFGTNWPGFMAAVGNIAGPLLAYEVLTAFFLEATFLGIMLFGFNRVSNKVHTVATILVAVGTSLSAFWILVLNSWMHTPVGFEMIDGRAHATSWLSILFNPSMPYRVIHMLLASGLTAAFLVAGVSAYRLHRDDRSPGVMVALKTGIYAAAILIPLQILAGDFHGLNTLAYQPVKVAAMEGVWETTRGAPALLFAVPNLESRANDFALGVPKLASFILTHDWDGEIKGINAFGADAPPVAPVFFSFRIMIGVGVLMLAAAWFATWQLLRRNTLDALTRRVLIVMTFSGWIATLAGWCVTEIGRQPYLVYGVLTTAQAAAQTVSSDQIGITLAMYLVLYAILIVSFISVLFYMARKATKSHHAPAVA